MHRSQIMLFTRLTRSFSVNCNSLLATLNARKGIRRDGDACNEHVSVLIDRALRPINSLIDSSQMVSSTDLHSTFLMCKQEMPNDLSIRLDTTQGCTEDEVSYVLYHLCNPMLIYMYTSFYPRRTSKGRSQFNCHMDENCRMRLSHRFLLLEE